MALELAEGGADLAPPTVRTHGLTATPARAAAGRPVAAHSSSHTAHAHAGTRVGPRDCWRPQAGLWALGGHYSTVPRSPVAKGAIGVSGSFGEGGGAHRGVSALIHKRLGINLV